MSEITDDDVVEAMCRYGGSFAKQLGRLFQLADDQNHARLRAAFPGYWARYVDLAKRQKGRRDEHP